MSPMAATHHSPLNDAIFFPLFPLLFRGRGWRGVFQPASNQRGSDRVHIIQVGRGKLGVQEDKERRGRFLRAGPERPCSDESIRNNLLCKEPIGLCRRYCWTGRLAGPLRLDPGLQERPHSARFPSREVGKHRQPFAFY